MPAVFVHGVLETSAIWDRLRAALATDSVVIELPGFGSSRPTQFTATKDSYAHWLAHALARLDGPIDLVGHEWGAILCVRIATAFDVTLRSWTADTARAFHPAFVWNQLARVWQTPGVGEAWVDAALDATPGSSASIMRRLSLVGVPEQEARVMGAAFDETTGRCILDLHRSAVPNLSTDWGAKVHTPTRAPGLVLIPAADPFNDEAMSRDVAGTLGARIEVLEDAGHSWMVEAPDAAAAVLHRFWNRYDHGDSPGR
jgi:pimeloyl-ACP methyl ester carboxylesterase